MHNRLFAAIVVFAWLAEWLKKAKKYKKTFGVSGCFSKFVLTVSQNLRSVNTTNASRKA
jgi:hypothetical protein